MTEKNTDLITTAYLKRLYESHGSTRRVRETLLRIDNVDIPERTIRYRLAKEFPDYKKDARRNPVEPELALFGGVVHSPRDRRRVLEGKKFVFTAAQNNTAVHEGFYSALLGFCMHNDAQLCVSKLTYNKSGFQNTVKDGVEDLWYDPRLEQYFLDESAQVSEDLVFGGELNILPTAVNPLSGFDSYFGDGSGIVPHTKVAMKSLPRMKHKDPRFLYTTGAVTLRNYIQKKAGQKAEFHHVFGALYVEVGEDGVWYARQLIADSDGTFQDLDKIYTPERVITDQSVLGIVFGDIHAEHLTEDNMETMYEMLHSLKPEYVFLHDLTDFSARNHHSIKDPHLNYIKQLNDKSSVEDGLYESYHVAKSLLDHQVKPTVVIVESNHDQALVRWLKDTAGFSDPINMRFWLEMNLKYIQHLGMHNTTKCNLFGMWLKSTVFPSYVTKEVEELNRLVVLQEDESFVIGNIEHGLHGHRGPNGARGNPNAYRSLGNKVNSGHTHSAGIYDGVYVAGVSCKLDMDYNVGPTSWSNSHVVTYRTGKRAIITARGRQWA